MKQQNVAVVSHRSVSHGFAGTKLSEVAKKAGVAKGTLYLYFDTREHLFRVTARQALAANLDAMEQASLAFGGSVVDFVPVLLKRAAGRMGDGRIPGIVCMVLGESRAFPDLACIWHDEVVSRVLTLLSGMIAKTQARGKIRPGANPWPHKMAGQSTCFVSSGIVTIYYGDDVSS